MDRFTIMAGVGLVGGRIGDSSVKYHGPALDVDHSLSARALAPALLDMADAIEAAKNGVSPHAKVDLRVQATKEDPSASSSSRRL